jgi:hypothetical protein
VRLPLNLDWSLAQIRWSSLINPLLANPLSSLIILDCSLNIGSNVINHKLGKIQQGWFLTDINGSAVIYRSAPLNNLTLTLTSSALVQVSIGVF